MFSVSCACDQCGMPIPLEYGAVDDLEERMTAARPQTDPFCLDVDGDEPHLCSPACREKYKWRTGAAEAQWREES